MDTRWSSCTAICQDNLMWLRSMNIWMSTWTRWLWRTDASIVWLLLSLGRLVPVNERICSLIQESHQVFDRSLPLADAHTNIVCGFASESPIHYHHRIFALFEIFVDRMCSSWEKSYFLFGGGCFRFLHSILSIGMFWLIWSVMP